MSAWTHRICGPCWNERNPGRQPLRVTNPLPGICCFCLGLDHGAGIALRASVEETACHGECGEALA